MSSNMKKFIKQIEENLYRIYIIVSVLICIFLFPFAQNMVSKFSNAYPRSGTATNKITLETASQVAIYIWPILIIYLFMLIILIARKNNHRKIYYPVSLLTITVIIFNLCILYKGFLIMWYIVILFYPVAALMIVLGIIGHQLDNNTLTKKKLGIILGSFLAIATIVLLSNLVINFINNKTRESMSVNTQFAGELNTQFTERTNETKEEFNNSLDSDWICVYDLTLSEDCSTIQNIELLITTENISDNEMDFCMELIDEYNNIKGLLNKYNYAYQTVHFEFTNKNPYAKADSTHYRESGYIRGEETIYYIYLNPKPLQINK